MNLKDKVRQEQLCSAQAVTPTMTEIKSGNVENGNSSSMNTMTRSYPPSEEMILLEKQSKVIDQLTAEKNQLIAEGREADQKKIQELSEQILTLKMEKKEKETQLQAKISDLEVKLSRAQDKSSAPRIANQELSKENEDLKIANRELSKEIEDLKIANRELPKENEDLRIANRELSKEYEDLRITNRELSMENEDLRKTYGIPARKEVRRLKERYAVVEEDNKIMKAQVKKIGYDAVLRNQRIAWISLLFTLICCLIRNKTMMNDMKSFIVVPFLWLVRNGKRFLKWMKQPYYTEYISFGETQDVPYSTGWSWMFRIGSLLLLGIALFLIGITVYCLVKYYRKRWCNLSLKVILATISLILVFGDAFRKHVPVNLVLVFLLVQPAYLLVLMFLDCHYECEGRLDKWELIQNR